MGYEELQTFIKQGKDLLGPLFATPEEELANEAPDKYEVEYVQLKDLRWRSREWTTNNTWTKVDESDGLDEIVPGLEYFQLIFALPDAPDEIILRWEGQEIRLRSTL